MRGSRGADKFTQNIGAVPPPRRSAVETRRLQLTIAGVAVKHPGLTCDEEREAELEEVLRALGLIESPDVRHLRTVSGRYRERG